jgi:hypothetical protein
VLVLVNLGCTAGKLQEGYRHVRLDFHPDLRAAKQTHNAPTSSSPRLHDPCRGPQLFKTNALFNPQTMAPIVNNSFRRLQDKASLFVLHGLRGSYARHLCDTLRDISATLYNSLRHWTENSRQALKYSNLSPAVSEADASRQQ